MRYPRTEFVPTVKQSMRQVGSIANQEMAERFADYLRAGGIACTVDAGADGYRIWVRDDDFVAKAKAELPLFLAEPDHQRYLDAVQLAKAKLRADLSRQKANRKLTVNLSEKWSRPVAQSCPLTFGLIAMSVAVAVFARFDPPHNDPRFDWLWFSNDDSMKQIFHGEVWRLITPIFLHFGPMHLLFNMLCVHQFGLQIESKLGTFKFLGMVLAIAVLSNTAQYLSQGASFGGMSGVDYGLFGYIWVKGKLEPESGFGLSQQTINMMLVWYVICLMGVVPNVANWAHEGGLLTGIGLAMTGSLVKPFLRRK